LVLREIEVINNTYQRSYTPGEYVNIANHFLPSYEAASKERQGSRSDLHSDNLSGSQNGEAMELIVTEILGGQISPATLRKAKQVVDAADQEKDPEFKNILRQMNDTGKVHPAYQAMKQLKMKNRLLENVTELAIDDDCSIHEGDFRELRGIIPEGEVDAMMTDPPYNKKTIPLFGKIAEMGAKILRPGGLLFAYSGTAYLPAVLNQLTQYLEYVGMITVIHTGWTKINGINKLRGGWKPIIICGKPPIKKYWNPTLDVIKGQREKDLHKWQQGESEVEYLVENFTLPGQLVVDPCCGSGTVPAVCKHLDRQCIGIDIDPDAVKIARERVSKATVDDKSKKK